MKVIEMCVDGKIIDIATAGTIKADKDTKVVDATGKYAVPVPEHANACDRGGVHLGIGKEELDSIKEKYKNEKYKNEK